MQPYYILDLLEDTSFRKRLIQEAATNWEVRKEFAGHVAKELSSRLAYTPARERFLRNRALLWQSIEGLIEGKESLEAAGRGVQVGLTEIRKVKKKLQEANQRLRQTRKELQEQERHILHSDRLAAVGELAAGVVHEINNPLGTIKGLVQLLEEQENINVSQHRDLRIIEGEIKDVQEIIRKLHSFARPNGLEAIQVDFHVLIDDIVSLMVHELTKHKVQLVKQYDLSLPKIVADANQLKQVFVNLILNAIQAMPNGGEITIRTQSEAKQVKITFTDTGTGMTRAVMKKIFTPFFTTKKEGTGLGLAVVQNIIRKHSGTISVASQVGKGTTFTITLPVKPASGRRSEREQP